MSGLKEFLHMVLVMDPLDEMTLNDVMKLLGRANFAFLKREVKESVTIVFGDVKFVSGGGMTTSLNGIFRGLRERRPGELVAAVSWVTMTSCDNAHLTIRRLQVLQTDVEI